MPIRRLSARALARMQERAERRAIRREQYKRSRMNVAQRFIYDLDKNVSLCTSAEAISIAISSFVLTHQF